MLKLLRILVLVSLGAGASAEENASNPLAAVNNADLRLQAFDLGGSDRQDFFIDGAYMLSDDLKLKSELHYNSTDVTAKTHTDFEATVSKLIYFPSERQVNETWGMRTA